MKQGWEIKKLGEVCEIINGFAFKSQLFREEGENILRISNIQNGYVDLTDIAHFSKDDYPKTNFEKYAVLPNDIVVALSGATTGKFGINKTGKKLYLNQRVAICRESSSKLHHLFLLYYLQTRSKSFLESAEGVAQPNLSTEQMKQYDIAIPPREEQKRIVAELDCLSGVIERKREQLRELDALAQSIFYQMFGDPITNEKGWDVKKIKDVAPQQEYKGDVPCVDGKYWLLNLDMVIPNTGEIIEKCYFDYDEIGNSTIIFNTDNVLYSKLRPYLNKVVIPNDIGYGTSELVPLKPHKDLLNKVFFASLLRSSYFVKYISGKVAGAKMPRVAMGEFRAFAVILPPLALQQEFADKIEAIEKQKELIKKSITQTEELFNSRMSYYFN